MCVCVVGVFGACENGFLISLQSLQRVLYRIWQFKARPNHFSLALKPASRPLFLRLQHLHLTLQLHLFHLHLLTPQTPANQPLCILFSGNPSGERRGGGGGERGVGKGGGGDVGQAQVVLVFGALALCACIMVHRACIMVRLNLVFSFCVSNTLDLTHLDLTSYSVSVPTLNHC